MAVVIDDHHLLALLANVTPDELAERIRSGVYTTGCWYYRLARAATTSGAGSLGRRIGVLSSAEQELVRQRLGQLPAGVGLLGWRTVVPVMAQLRVRHPLNLLSAEALAVAIVTSADIVLSTESPHLTAGASDLGVSCDVHPLR
jgi:hypothetical protein